MRTIIISLILLFVFQTVYSQKYSYTDTDIIVCDGDSTYLFKNILYPSVSYFMSCDSLNSDLAYIHYENWASSRKTESILQIKYEKGSLYVISEFLQKKQLIQVTTKIEQETKMNIKCPLLSLYIVYRNSSSPLKSLLITYKNISEQSLSPPLAAPPSSCYPKAGTNLYEKYPCLHPTACHPFHGHYHLCTHLSSPGRYLPG